MSKEEVVVMIAGLPGAMGALSAEGVFKSEFTLCERALSLERGSILIGGKRVVEYFPPEEHIDVLTKEPRPDIVMDFTDGDAVNRNAEMYCDLQTPFVMGTTGGDREALKKTIESSSISAVVAPNMAKQVVVFQAMMEWAKETFPGAFKGYKRRIIESHQKHKTYDDGTPKPSGTAKAVLKSLEEWGSSSPEGERDIISIRDPEVQEHILGIPSEHLDGHGWHTYDLWDKTSFLRFVHNVNGRDMYINGVMDAIRFLLDHKEQGKMFTMIDVLKS